jgi:hypothetical protein
MKLEYIADSETELLTVLDSIKERENQRYFQR